MNFLVPYTKTLDTKGDGVVGNKSFDETQFDDLKTDEEPSSYEHEIMQDEESNVVYEAYEISEPIQTSTSAGSGKSQITLVRSTTGTNPNVQQIAVNQLSASPQQKHQTQIHQLNSSQISQIQNQTATSSNSQTIPVQNTLIPISDDQTADLNFFLALLPDIKTMNQEQKRVFRLGALKLIDDILTGNR